MRSPATSILPGASVRPTARGESLLAQQMRSYKFIDYATQAYVALVGLLILFFHAGRVQNWLLLVEAHALCLLVVHLLVRAHARRPQDGLMDLLRHFYPIVLYTGLYCEIGMLNQMFVRGYLDGFFIRLDQRLFGLQPSLAFMDRLPYLAISELFYVSYFSYYVMIVGIGAILYLQQKERFFNYVSIISFVFYVCFLVYILLPVVGARVFWAHVPGFNLPADLGLQEHPIPFPPAVQVGPFFKIMEVIYRYFEAHGAAFPSSHVAVALGTLYFSWRYMPKMRYIHLVVVILLILSTVYCRYHYVVDVMAGVLTAAVLIPLGQLLYDRFGAAPAPAAARHAPGDRSGLPSRSPL